MGGDHGFAREIHVAGVFHFDASHRNASDTADAHDETLERALCQSQRDVPCELLLFAAVRTPRHLWRTSKCTRTLDDSRRPRTRLVLVWQRYPRLESTLLHHLANRRFVATKTAPHHRHPTFRRCPSRPASNACRCLLEPRRYIGRNVFVAQYTDTLGVVPELFLLSCGNFYTVRTRSPPVHRRPWTSGLAPGKAPLRATATRTLAAGPHLTGFRHKFASRRLHNRAPARSAGGSGSRIEYRTGSQ